ncbi:hypothetical protein [Aquimarina sp. RZ0]|uniref:hypothetical protein n=1 Tax=Aquimarina sp. RZ0 TaxID=2607730 RepID=UPI0011F0ECFA|nr:hypothetical protein [Aquimarina sp. RZ0]KAA1243541.1 hypothetical protein F0000_20605 [Aquimarina sp. RZ0]
MKYISVILVLFFTAISCISESADNLFPTNDVEANIVYETELKSVIESKCISCHSYHLEGSNRYDTFDKTKSSIGQMLERINAVSNIVMPPDESPQLTEGEKLIFQEFFDVLNNGSEPVVLPFKLTWTAYKYAIFEERGGVSGTFEDIQYVLNQEYEEPIDILKDAEIRINTASVNIDGLEGVRTMNVGTQFFPFFTSQIKGKVSSYTQDIAVISFEMNGIEQEVIFDVIIEEDILKLTGTIDDMSFFEWDEAYNQLETVCGEFHENMVWPDIDLEAEILLTK